MKTIYLIRHGEILATKPRRFIGRTELPLTTDGKEQILSLGKVLARHSFDKLICSPLSRCQESGAILAGALGTTIEMEDGLSEIDLGDWEGLTVAEVQSTFPGEYEKRGENLLGYRPKGGESFSDLHDRVWPALLKIIEATTSAATVVAHAGVNRVLLCHVLGLSLDNMFQLPQDYGCYNILYADQKGIRIGCVNCVPDVL